MIFLELQRKPTVKATTLGRLFIGGVFECDILEDAIRETVFGGVAVEAWKIKGNTAIPAGRYRVILVNSPKFGPDTLSIEGVPGFSEIRIHSGNDDADTDGCLLTGSAVPDPQGDGGDVINSRVALAALKAKLVPKIKAGEECWIQIRNPVKP
jgi:hypothetical protein